MIKEKEISGYDQSNEKIDQLEATMVENGAIIDCPLKHTFTDGMYIREIFIPAGSLATSLIHKTKHPFFVMKGSVSVYSENDGVQLIESPFHGITIPNTRRVLYAHSDVVWITCHSTLVMPSDYSEEEIIKAVDKIGEMIIEQRPNPILGGMIKNNVLTKMVHDEI